MNIDQISAEKEILLKADAVYIDLFLFSFLALKRIIPEPEAQVSQRQESHEHHEDDGEHSHNGRKSRVQDTHF